MSAASCGVRDARWSVSVCVVLLRSKVMLYIGWH
jgi:hypothetical protein